MSNENVNMEDHVKAEEIEVTTEVEVTDTTNESVAEITEVMQEVADDDETIEELEEI